MNLIETIYDEVEEDNYGKLGKAVELGDKGLDLGILKKLTEKEIISEDIMKSLVYIFDFKYKEVVSFLDFILGFTDKNSLEELVLGYLEIYKNTQNTRNTTSKILSRFGSYD